MLVVYKILLPESTHNTSPSLVALASLGVVFFLASRESLAADVGRNVIRVFLLHSICSLIITVYQHLYSRDRVCERMLLHVMTALQVFWTICGTLAIRRMVHLLHVLGLSN